MLDWLEHVEQVREMPKEKRDALIVERREMGMLDSVFRLKDTRLQQFKKQALRGVLNSEPFKVNQKNRRAKRKTKTCTIRRN